MVQNQNESGKSGDGQNDSQHNPRNEGSVVLVDCLRTLLIPISFRSQDKDACNHQEDEETDRFYQPEETV